MEPADALADAASGEGDVGAPLDANQLRKIAETGNHFFYSVCSQEDEKSSEQTVLNSQ